MEDLANTPSAYTKTLDYLRNLTARCIDRCDSLDNLGTLSSKQQQCLKLCAENQAIATRIHSEFIRTLAEKRPE